MTMRKNLIHGIDITAPDGVSKLLAFHRLTFGDARMEVGDGPGNTAPAGDNNDQVPEFKAPATQADLDRIIQDRVARVKSSYSDYEDLKAKAGQVQTFEERVAELEAANSELDGKVKTFEAEKTRAALVAGVAKDKNVPATALRGDTLEELEAHADELAALLKPSGPVIPDQERTPDKMPDSPDREFARKLFGKD